MLTPVMLRREKLAREILYLLNGRSRTSVKAESTADRQLVVRPRPEALGARRSMVLKSCSQRVV